MPSILGTDEDTTFLSSVKTLTKNIPIAFSFSTGFLFGKKKKCMIKDLNERGIKASVFFQQKGCTSSSPVSIALLEKALTENASQQTLGKFYQKASCIHYAQSDCRLIKAKVANEDFARELVKEGHSEGLHAVHTRDYRDFSRDLSKISERLDGGVCGFTKHDFTMGRYFIND